jgi:quinolinate synthase
MNGFQRARAGEAENAAYPQAKVIAHPRMPGGAARITRDHIGSTSSLLTFTEH